MAYNQISMVLMSRWVL